VATKLAHLRQATLTPTLPTAEVGYLLLKRVFDVALALVLIVALAPVMALVALAIALDSPGPVVFRQRRVLGDQALGARRPQDMQFEFCKFRTMYHRSDDGSHRAYVTRLINGQAHTEDASGEQVFKLAHDPRITRVGRILRKTSLDELPQLFNILSGEMTFVGPRPALPYEVEQYKPWHMSRLTVPQGLTGMWQVMGRNQLNFDEMVQLDIEYARRRSTWLDIKIILATIPAVILGRGVC